MAEIKIDDTGQDEEVKKTPETEKEQKAAEDSRQSAQASAAAADGSSDRKEAGDNKESSAGSGTESGDTPTEKQGDTDKTSAPTGNEKDEKKSGFFSKKKDKETEALKQKNAELTDQLQRLYAEFDNYRKRTEKEKESMFSMGEQSVAEKILPIVDNFERGLAVVKDDEKDNAFVQGMQKVYQQTLKQLEAIGVKPFESEGKPFDQNFHKAVMQAESDEKHPSGTVVQELQKGYMYHDKVLRHSMVSVAK